MEKMGIVRLSNSPWASPFDMSSRRTFTEPRFSPKSTWCAAITKSRSTLMISPRRLSPPRLGFRILAHAFRPNERRPGVPTAHGHRMSLTGFRIHIPVRRHLNHLRQLFQRINDHGPIINLIKCQFGLTSIDFLGHRINQHRAVPLPDNLEAVHQFAMPTLVKAFQEFVGMANFYHRFVPSAAQISQVLYKTLAGNPRELVWDETTSAAFDNIKEALAKATMLVHPQPNALTAATVKASGTAVGAVLEQLIKNNWQPLAIDRELFALYLAIQHFWYFIEGRHFIAFTDIAHRLTIAIAKHVSRKCNQVAIHALAPEVDYAAIATAQMVHEETQAYRNTPCGLILEDVRFRPTEATLLCAPYTTLRYLDSHDPSFPLAGAAAYSTLYTSYQGATAEFSPAGPPFRPHPRGRSGPLPLCRGHTHLFIIMDRFTRWPEAIPLSDTSSMSCAWAFIAHWIARYGIPINISSDRGAQFSALWTALAQLIGIRLHRTTAYHPQASDEFATIARLCAKNEETFNQPLLHTEVRWLSRGDCLQRLCCSCCCKA
ncbi:Transposon Ty3-G Gag-Pol polyprotein [Trichinella zimbabwensis]|uniref:Transposon Ty3-G Gag-Pol polyprotein n=1 Tax=Trichinella zimbabwensis TaxID=268475 RepID=A0A0V1I561_9BILA|nr:Transposon Ty3-G Gag-Pol polyprotein [Trichinella zimbabwensis]